jgi:CheY-like chemotaxis protein
VIAPDAEQGIEFALHENPAAILLDVKLPDHSGLMVLDRLKHDSRTRHIPIHVVSGYDFSRAALQMGAVGYALKPVKREELRKAFELLRGKIGGGDMQNILIVEEDPAQRRAICALLDVGRVKMTAVGRADEALRELGTAAYDCMVMGLILPDMSGFELLDRIAEQDGISHPPVIVYTSRDLTSDEEARLRRHSQSVIIKGAHSPERLLEEATLFLHRVEAGLAPERQRMLQALRHREETFENKTLLLVDDDMRNVFALSAVLEERGARVLLAKNGRDALDKMARNDGRVDLVLMDVMMPVMDGLTAIRELRLRPDGRHLPIIALTAKATKDDRAECLEAGANDYLPKPVDVEKLLSLIRVWLSHSEGRQA